MNGSISQSLELEIETALEILFSLQDKTLGKEKKVIWMQELMGSNLPAGAILQALRSLKMEDVASLKFATVISAARRYVEPAEIAKACENCRRGFAILCDEQGREFSLACSCFSGNEKAGTHNLVRWNGEDSQSVNGRILFRKV